MSDPLRSLLDLPPAASTAAAGIDELLVVVLALSLAVALAITIVIARAVRRRNAPLPPSPGPSQAPRPTTGRAERIELVLAGVTLAVFVALWVVGFAQLKAMHEPPADAMEIYVVGKQWMWQFVYPDGTASEDDLRVPVGRPIALAITSRDVIHSFYVPAFRDKQDAVPGRMTSMWFTATAEGTYDIRCAEYCGAGHSRMSGHVIAMAPADFERWRASHASPDLAHAGAAIAARKGCIACHANARIAPSFVGLYGSQVALADGTTATADAAYLSESIMDPSAKVRAGYAPTMPSYLGQLSASDTAAVIEWIREQRGGAP